VGYSTANGTLAAGDLENAMSGHSQTDMGWTRATKQEKMAFEIPIRPRDPLHRP
jgi:hypothetical protein